MTRLDKLVAFIDSGKMDEVVTDNYQKFLLRLQQVVMGNYVKTLECRIGCLDGAPNAPFNQMSFGVAIEALKFGLAIRRKGWNGKGLWVIKQVPAHIESDIVPKMQSLPQSAKDLILKGKGFINYTSQCLIYNENTGRADSWIPSISDVVCRRLGDCSTMKFQSYRNSNFFCKKLFCLSMIISWI